MAQSLKLSFRQNKIAVTPFLVAAGNFNLIGWNLINWDSNNAYVKFYNAKQVSDVTVGVTVPIKTLFVPASGTAFLSAEAENLQDAFTLGMVIAVTTSIDDANSSAPANGVSVELKYEANV